MKKAFDSVDHDYLINRLKMLNLPKWGLNFICIITKQWKLNVRLNNEEILAKKVERGILQGDSLSHSCLLCV